MVNPGIIKLFLIWFLSVLFIFYFGFSIFPRSEIASVDFWENFSNWDGKYYLSIAQHGYRQDLEYAFFPGYPLAVGIVSQIINNFQLSAIVTSSITSFFAILMFYKLVLLDFKKEIAQRAVIFLLFFPTSFFLLTTYSESLFLFLAISSFYFFRKMNFFYAAFFGALASLVRPVGIIIALAFFIQLLGSGGFNRKNYVSLFAPLGLIGYSLYLYLQTQDPLFFLTAQQNWQRSITLPWISFGQTINNIFQPGFIDKYFYVFLNLLFAILGLGLSIRSFRFLPTVYCVYALGSVMLPLATSTLSSMPRFLITIFPLFILLAMIKNHSILFLYQILSLMLLSAFAILFINGYWIS